MPKHSPLYLLLAILIGCPWLSSTAAITPEELDYFETHVRPNLIKYCYECHSVEQGESRGGLYLDTREGMQAGGSTGPLFEGPHPLFVDAITWADEDYEMPPKKKMPQDVIDKLLKWVAMGAPDPRERKTHTFESKIDFEAGKSHWAYQRPTRPALQSIDAILAEKRQQQGLSPVAPADPLTLLRRLNFDLIGLPPTPPEIKAFHQAYQNDPEKAYRSKVEELLASEHYGERWGRHWLDVVRFGESAGTMNVTYPYAWRFRNYVIDSFNRDKPYDRLLTEHLAGDLLPATTDTQTQELTIATGYLAVGPKKQNDKDPKQFHMNLVDEQIDTTTRAFLATTVACARCHDHKFDPISTADYYAMAGIFQSTETLWGTIGGNQNHRVTDLLRLPIADQIIEPTSSNTQETRSYQEVEKELEEARTNNRETRQKLRQADGDLEAAGLTDRNQLVKLRQRILRLESELELLNPDGSTATYAMGARETKPTNAHILLAGDYNTPAQSVPRGFPTVLQHSKTPAIPEDQSGRLQLAAWITSPSNPLTARVMVNRIWMHLTGKPIVATMDNFGTTGLAPSNQELLDHLAIRFMEQGWSIKALIRDIVHSDTYQLASTFHPDMYAKDPDNATSWRANPRQLDAEALRDQMLLVSGQLDRKRPQGSLVQKVGDTRVGEGFKRNSNAAFQTAHITTRSLYLPMFREAMTDELALFDAPDPAGTIGQRATTNVAPQSLHLMNSELVHRLARAMGSVLHENFRQPRDQVSNAFLLAYSRPASQEEVTAGLTFLSNFEPGEAPKADRVQAAASQERGRGRNREEGRGMQKGRGKNREGRGGGRRRSQEVSAPTPEPLPAMTLEEAKIAAFCQALMMSAEFRMIH